MDGQAGEGKRKKKKKIEGWISGLTLFGVDLARRTNWSRARARDMEIFELSLLLIRICLIDRPFLQLRAKWALRIPGFLSYCGSMNRSWDNT